VTESDDSPIGKEAAEAAKDRARDSDEYLDVRAEYERIAKLRRRDPAAADERERRFEAEHPGLIG